MSSAESEIGVICPACKQMFSKRESRLRDEHMLVKHHSYLRWQCASCTYTTGTHRRHDHHKHWESRHFGEFIPPRPTLVLKSIEDKRQQEERQRRDQRAPSQERPPTRVSPRKARRDSSKRPRHPSSPSSTTQPSAKRSSSSRGSSRGAQEAAASASRASTPRPSSSSPGTSRRTPRKSLTPQKRARRPPSATETTARPEGAPTTAERAESPVPGPSVPAEATTTQREPVLDLHPGPDSSFGDSGDEEAGRREEQAERPASPAQDQPPFKDQVKRWIRTAPLEDCREMRRALDEREAQLTGAAVEARPQLPGGPAAATFVWRPTRREGRFSVTLQCREESDSE